MENGRFVLPLRAGRNEILVALAKEIYSWGLLFRLENTMGARLAER